VASTVNPSIPVVVVCNISETFYDFLSLAENSTVEAHLIRGEQYRGDRALIWVGDPKLVFVSLPIPNGKMLCQQLGYDHTQYAVPAEPSAWLSLDILREQALMDQLVAYAGTNRTLQIIPYATTRQFYQLVDSLRADYGLTIILPESPSPESFWLRDYVDTKAGFRALASRWLPNADELLPEGYVCQTLETAAEVVHWFGLRQLTCIVKANIGENGLGNLVVRPGDFETVATILEFLHHHSFMHNLPLTVEAYVSADKLVSPSLEVFVPPLGQGDPYITYVSDQVFQGFGDFCGVLVTRDLLATSWYKTLADSGLLMAKRLQELHYVGHFDMDAVVNDEGRAFLVEINPRRTGGSHVHDFARFFFGSDYLDKVSLLSNDTLKSGAITDVTELLEEIGDLLYPIEGQQRGAIVTVTSALEAHEFGCIFIGPTQADVLALQQQMVDRMAQLDQAKVS